MVKIPINGENGEPFQGRPRPKKTTKQVLDEAIRAHYAHEYGEGYMADSWVVFISGTNFNASAADEYYLSASSGSLSSLTTEAMAIRLLRHVQRLAARAQ